MSWKCNLTDAEAQAAFDEFEPCISADEEAALSEKFTQYVFFDTYGRRNFRDCMCTSCGAFELYRDEAQGFFKYHHGDMIECPNCGTEATLYAAGRMKTGASLTEYQRAVFARAGQDGALLLTAGVGRKQYSPYDMRPMVEWEATRRTYLAPGKRMQWEKRSWYCEKYERAPWQARKTVTEPFSPNGYYSDGSYWYLFSESIEDTKMRYCQMEDWYHDACSVWLCEQNETVRGIHYYLAAYTEYPAMEMAVKFGLQEAATELAVDGKKNHRYLNWAAKTPWEFLRMPKADAKGFLRAGGNLKDLMMVKDLIRDKLAGSVREVYALAERAGGMCPMQQVVGIAKEAGTDLRGALRYIDKNTPECSRAGVTRETIVQYWRDYLDMAKKLGYDLTEPTVAMPKDLKERHDVAAQTLRVQQSQEERKKYQKRYKKLCREYEFELNGLKVIVPTCTQEIVHEGKVLHHCVGGYAKRHVDGKVDILFLRRARKPDTPFLTIEMVPRESQYAPVILRQIHGYKNEHYNDKKWEDKGCSPEDKYAWFLEAWLQWLKGGSKRDKDGKPIIKTNREDKTA